MVMVTGLSFQSNFWHRLSMSLNIYNFEIILEVYLQRPE